MTLALAIRIATVTWIATFLSSVLLHLPWFILVLGCCPLILVGGLIARRYHGADRREGLVYVTGGLAFCTMVLFLAPEAPLRNVDMTWFFVITISLVLTVVVLMLVPDNKEDKEKSKQR
jgi:hypothetical protein